MSGNLPIYPRTVQSAEEASDLVPTSRRSSTPPPVLASYATDAAVSRYGEGPPCLERMDLPPPDREATPPPTLEPYMLDAPEGDVNSPPPFLENAVEYWPSPSRNFDEDYEMAMEIINEDMEAGPVYNNDLIAEFFFPPLAYDERAELPAAMEIDEEEEEEEEEAMDMEQELEEEDEEAVQTGGGSALPLSVEETDSVDPSQDVDDDDDESQSSSAGPSEVNVRDLYDYEEVPAETRTWRRVATRRTFLMNFRGHPEILNEDELLSAALVDLISVVIPLEDNVHLGMELSWNGGGGDKQWCAPYRPLEAYHTGLLQREFASRTQSARTVGALNGPLSVTFTTVKRLAGSGRPRTMGGLVEALGETSASDPPTRNWRNITPNRVSDLCLGTAMLQALHHHQVKAQGGTLRDQRWKKLTRVTDRSRRIRTEARRLLRAAGIRKNSGYTVDDVMLLQTHFHQQYQIILLNDDHSSTPIYSGPFVSPDKVIALLCKDDHYSYVKKLHRFLGHKFYCALCHTVADEARSHYTCPLRCRKCLREKRLCDAAVPSQGLHCAICSVKFGSMDCFNAHIQLGPQGGSSRCMETKKCYMCFGVYYSDRGYNHVCGEHYCKTCGKMRGAGHLCMMSRKPINLKNIHEKRVYFDLETTTEMKNGIAYHKVVLAAALRCCKECRDTIPRTRTEAMALQCDTCSPDGQRFWEFDDVQPGNINNLDVMNQFGDWLIHQRHANFVLIAHNMKGFDGQFLLQHLFKMGKPTPECVVLDGKKVNFVSVAGIRIVDSYNFVPFGLATFPKAFNIPHLVKGDFPVLFIDKANYNYVGPMPDRRFYPDSTGSAEKRAKFEEFYTDQLAVNHVFQFREELFDYCFADVALLAAAMTKFEQKFMATTGVMLFEEAVTAASAAMTTFRRGHLPADSIVLDMAPSGKGIKQSVIGARYLYWREFHEQKFVQTGMNLGEYQLPKDSDVDLDVTPKWNSRDTLENKLTQHFDELRLARRVEETANGNLVLDGQLITGGHLKNLIKAATTKKGSKTLPGMNEFKGLLQSTGYPNSDIVNTEFRYKTRLLPQRPNRFRVGLWDNDTPDPY